MVTLTFLSINLVLAGGRPLEIVSDLSMGDLRSRKILYPSIGWASDPRQSGGTRAKNLSPVVPEKSKI